MSDYENLVKARAAADDMRVQSQLSGMDPGYATGFTLTLDVDYQVTVSAGATTVFGSEVRIAAATQLTDNMFLGTKFGPFWYYIYITREGTFVIDRAVPSLSTTLFYYTHPFAEHRAIGRVWVSDSASTRLKNEIIYVQQDIPKADPEVFIAPSDTFGGAEAAYKLTGTGDETLINASIQYLSEVHSGGVARVLRGSVSTAAVITLLANVELIGDGVATVVAGTEDDVIITSTSTACAIRRMKLTSVATSSGKDVIYYNGADDSIVEGVVISGSSVDGVVLNDSDRVILRDIEVADAKTGINIEGTSSEGLYSDIYVTMPATVIGGGDAKDITLIGFSAGSHCLRYNASNITIFGLATSEQVWGALIDGDESNLNNFVINDIVSTGQAAMGISISSSNCHFSNINVKTVTGSASNGDGVRFEDTASTNTVVNLEANTCNGTGLLLHGDAQYVTIFGAILSGNGTDLTNSGTRNTIITNNSTAEFSGPLDEALTIDSAGVDMAGTLDVTGDVTVDTNTFFVDVSENRVGIGTTSPTETLTVDGDGARISLRSNDFEIARIINVGTGASLDIGMMGLFNGASEDVRIRADNNSWFNGGNVGIGTASPTLGLVQLTKASGSDVDIAIDQDGVGHWRIRNVATTGDFGIYNGQLGAVAMTIDRITSNVGIGTASPAKILSIYGGTTDPAIQITTDDTGQGATDGFQIAVQQATMDAYIHQREAADIRFLIAGSAAMIIENGGNVGIGTDGPKTPLSAIDDTSDDNVMSPGTASGVLSLQSTGNNYGMFLGTRFNAGDGWIQVGRSDGTATAYNLLLQANGGNVGIGTTSPTETLTVDGDGARISLRSNDFEIARIINVGTGASLDIGMMSLFNGAFEDVRIRADNNSWFNGGNVGIGTASPATSSILELSTTTGALLLTRMTTTQRDALTAVNGMIIYNITNNVIEGYENGSWVNI